MAASPSNENLRSQFENVFQILPQGHDKVVKKAFYSTAATLFVIVVCCASVALYHILLPFIRPLLWALLCGTVLFPLKYRSVTVVRGWLQGLQSSGTPLVVGTVLLPLTVADAAAVSIVGVVWNYGLPVALGGVVALAAYMIIYVWLGRAFIDFLIAAFCFVYDAVGYFKAFWVWSLVCAFLIAVIYCWTPQRNVFFKLSSIFVWLALLFHIATAVGPLRVPLVLVVVSLLLVSLVSGLHELFQSSNGSETVLQQWLSGWFESHASIDTLSETTSESLPVPISKTQDVGDTADESHSENATSEDTSNKSTQSKMKSSIRKTPPSSLLLKRSARKTRQTLADRCLIWLLWSLVIVHLCIYKAFFLIFPTLIVLALLKKLDAYLGLWQGIKGSIGSYITHWKQLAVEDPRVDIVLPRSARRLGKWLLRGDSKVVQSLDGAMDKIVSILIICFLIIFVILVALFATLEIHRESMHLVQLSSNLMNKSVHPELAVWLPDEDFVSSTLDSFVNNTYVYGREWISSKLRGFLSGNDEAKEQIEVQVLKVWDKIYGHWFAKNISGTNTSLQRQTSIDLSLSDMPSASDVINKLQLANLDIVAFAQENVGVLLSSEADKEEESSLGHLMETIWTVLSSNLALLTNLIFTVLSLVFGGGTALLNIILEAVVFFSALFYLLSSSSNCYKPVELFVGASPSSGSSSGMAFGKAFEDAIGSVFLASIKLALFYGLYTWLTHLLFGIEIVFIPSVLAAVLAAMPFIGTYMAALPAVMDLWLVRGCQGEAIMLFIAHYVPTLFVDTAMYSEIKGGHPYMTGLAIAGGIYWMGVEGAIVGPVLLCCVIVAINMYQNMLKPSVSLSTSDVIPGAAEKRVKFNMTRQGSSVREVYH